MSDEAELSDLLAFARDQIDAQRFPGDYHHFRPFTCSSCGLAPFEMRIEHHTGSKKGNFRGMIWGSCARCGKQQRLFSFTGEGRMSVRVERYTCRCGHGSFLAAELERIERDNGLPGFFDEGVVVGKCTRCGRRQAIVHTD